MKDFVEASARVVKFPGVSCFAFRELLLYLYTDRAPSPRLSPANCLQVIELANRLCLPVRAVWFTKDDIRIQNSNFWTFCRG